MNILERSSELQKEGFPFAVATVVRRRPPASARVGDKAVILADGSLEGWVGGNCSQAVVRRQALESLQDGRPRLVLIRSDEVGDGVAGGAADGLAVEHRSPASGHQAPVGVHDAPDGVVSVPMTCASGGDLDVYIEPHLEPARLLVFGESPLAGTLVDLANRVGMTALRVDGSALDQPDEIRVTGRTFAVVATMGYYDEDALSLLLKTPAPYVGLVASRRRAAEVSAFLRDQGLNEEETARIRNPAGLDIGAATQEEIALSILAEVVQERRRAAIGLPRTQGEIVGEILEPNAMASVETPRTARDPVCGMDVDIAGARHTLEHDGVTYYFCCPHCREAFAADPGRYTLSA